MEILITNLKQQSSAQPKASGVDERLTAALTKFESFTYRADGMEQMLHSQGQTLIKLETQVGQLANSMNQREKGKLPS